jgi:hypothetical protein
MVFVGTVCENRGVFFVRVRTLRRAHKKTLYQLLQQRVAAVDQLPPRGRQARRRVRLVPVRVVCSAEVVVSSL